MSFTMISYPNKTRWLNQSGISLINTLLVVQTSGTTSIENNKNRLEIIDSEGNYITDVIKKGKNGKEDYDVPYISKLRKKLKLTEEYGVDSQCFYSGFSEDSMNRFMHARHEVMRKLAKIQKSSY